MAKTAVATKAETMPSTEVGVDTSKVGGVPYVVFTSTKSPRYPELALMIPGLKEPDVVLIQPAPMPPIRLSPFRAFLVAAREYWATIQEDGEVTRVVRTRPDPWDASLKQVIEAAVIVHNGEKLVPARATFKTYKCSGAALAAKALKLASSPEWAGFSDAHAATLQLPAPYMRFTATFRMVAGTAKTGRKYYRADASIIPTTVAEAKLLKAAQDSPEWLSQAKAVSDSLARRIMQMEEIAG